MDKVSVLVVEDDVMLADILARFVSKVDGFQVIAVAYTVEEAVQAAKTTAPDLVLLDVYLDGSGVDVLKEIRARDLKADIIMVTAAQDSTTVSASMRYGVVDYIVKPFQFARLQQALTSYALMFDRLEQNNKFTQHDIDRLRRVTIEGRPDLPKNVDEKTLETVLQVLREQEWLSAADMTATLAISYATVKRYLNYLVEVQRVKVQLKYNAKGRPVTFYKYIG